MRPVGCLDHPGRSGPRTDSVRLGTLVTSATSVTRPAGDHGHRRGPESRRAGEFGSGGLVRGRALGLRHRFPAHRRTLDPLEETTGHRSGLWRAPRARRRLRRHPLPGLRLPRPARAGGARRPPIVIGGKAGPRHPGPGRPLRERVRRSVRLGRVRRHPVRAGPRGLRGGPARPIRTWSVRRAGDLRGHDEAEFARGPRRSARTRTRSGTGLGGTVDQARSGGPLRRGRRPRSTCGSSISTTWTISTCSPSWPAQSHIARR